ncbi:MAG: hypothetical protein WBP59_03775, partial [Ilumatobacteraceae bacterium]
MRRNWLIRTALALVLATFMSSLAIVTSPPSVTEAARQAPRGPLPNCVYDEFDNAGLGCIPDDSVGTATIGGTFSQAGTFTVSTEPPIAPCFH